MKKKFFVFFVVFVAMIAFITLKSHAGQAQSVVDNATTEGPREITPPPYAPATERSGTDDCSGPYSPPPRAECGPSWSMGYSTRYEAIPRTETVRVNKLVTRYRDETRTRMVPREITVPEERTITVERPVTELQTVTRFRTVEECVPVERTVCVQDPCDPCRQIPKTCITQERRCVTVPYTCEVPVTRCVPELVTQTVNVRKCVMIEEQYTVRVPYTECVEEEQAVTVNDYRAVVTPRPCPPPPGRVYPPASCGPCPPPAPLVLKPWPAPTCPPPCTPVRDFFEAIGDGLAELFGCNNQCQPCPCPPNPCWSPGPPTRY